MPRLILMFQMEESNEYERQRLIAQPGLTCYWQIGGRAKIKWEDWVELDLDYIENMSLWTDIKIIVKTIPAVFDRERTRKWKENLENYIPYSGMNVC